MASGEYFVFVQMLVGISPTFFYINIELVIDYSQKKY